ncbi:hypothetical protein DSM106972_019460 [Dulcicalothrix desertica PCC 7102]|uniref:AMIN domain-containing protein n=1 Tax=Dulcicalothrix desertica PCC 7102 TaxID=232991 RepID=A0A3S1CHT9_9CYAN|nr:AMIN domain-containing protein [Dulcicalothrix desertica]RUT07686.1 hypothetical protein DSM106972_019460 [Dulcicalothrix desertica PCC 7102]
MLHEFFLLTDIPNAVLALPDTDNFTTENPAEGISVITVTQLENKVQVRVTGVDNAPTVTAGFGDPVTYGVQIRTNL